MSEAVSCASLMDVWSELESVDVVGIDEGQFFPDLVEFADRAGNEGKRVIVAALDATFEREAFGDVCRLLPVAEQVTKLSAVCTACGADAAFTLRTTGETEVEVIGGAEMYTPRCRACFGAAGAP